MKILSSLILFVARACVASVFLVSGASKVMFFDQTAQFMTAKGMEAVPLLLVGAIIIELAGGVSLFLGYKTRLAALGLSLFLIYVNLTMHAFWHIVGADQALEQVMFFKNVGIVGALLYVLCEGPGGCAFDACCRKTHDSKTS